MKRIDIVNYADQLSSEESHKTVFTIYNIRILKIQFGLAS